MTDKDKNFSPNSPGTSGILQNVLDAIPIPVFVIDRDAHVEMVNTCAKGQRNLFSAYTYRERMGNVLGCINALSCSDGCGGSRNCKDCPVRKAVADVLNGRNVFRERVVFQLLVDGEYYPIHMWLTASLLRYGECDFVAMILEDIAELGRTTGLIPVCTSCGKVGGGTGYHESLESYIKGRFDEGFKQGLCTDCTAQKAGSDN
ncbi:MAG: hypothetical protein QGH60_19995 [Phycisphaerae bacterium]|jgi:hypothetical protein|nr:hypothetical protein [Phycisphaerae bacterium]